MGREMSSFLNPMDTVRAIQVDHHRDLEVPDFPRIKKVVDRLALKPPGILLDIGYSRGSFADYMIDRGWRCIGLDLTKHLDQNLRFVQCDVNYGLPIRADTINAVTGGEIIEHVLDESGFLQECYRVLKSGGTLVLTTPNLVFWVNRVRILAGKTPLFVYAPYHFHFHTRKTIESMMRENGFEIERVISSHLLFSRRRHSFGVFFEWLGDLFPSLGAHLIIFGRKR